MSSELPFLVGDLYLVQKKLSQGSFGTVFFGTELNTKKHLAVKIEKENIGTPTKCTTKEVSILQRLKDVVGIPQLIWFNENTIILSLLGKDLNCYLKIFKKFSQKTIIMLTYQLISILEEIHKKGVLHRDLKPENILVGRGENCKQIYLIDFGISKIAENLKEICFKENKSFVGTARYASVAAHKGYEMGPKDDLESLFYVMVFCTRGVLPWQKVVASEEEKILRVGKIKEELSVQEICEGMSLEFIEAFGYIRKLKFEENVDYEYLKDLMIECSESADFDMDDVFDWISPFQIDKKFARKKIQTVVDAGYEDQIKIQKTNTNVEEEKGDIMKPNLHYSSQISLENFPANSNGVLVEKYKKFKESSTLRFQKLTNELLTIPGTDSFQVSENSSNNLSSRCSSLAIKYENSEDSCGLK